MKNLNETKQNRKKKTKIAVIFIPTKKKERKKRNRKKNRLKPHLVYKMLQLFSCARQSS